MHKKFCFVFFILIFSVLNGAEDNPKKNTVCLNMIVKNESKVIKRCLDSVRPIIDHWIIVDTGSTDGTQTLIKNIMKDIPGELYERPWKNFGHNRNEALELAKGKSDYILFIDADEVFSYDKDFKLPKLDKDFYYFTTKFGGTEYKRVQLIKSPLSWKWKGVLHEAVDAHDAKSRGTIDGIFNVVHTDGARSQDPEKYKKDAEILLAGLAEEPNNTRYVFYLAQSYKDYGDVENSVIYYQKRTEMGGWNEEIFWSKFQIAAMQQALEKPSDVIVKAYMDAYHYRPSRIEPLYYLANYYRSQGKHMEGYLIASLAVKLPPSKDMLFVQTWIQDYGAPLEKSICAYWIGNYDECAQISKELLTKTDLPQNVRECLERNLKFAEEKLAEIDQKKF